MEMRILLDDLLCREARFVKTPDELGLNACPGDDRPAAHHTGGPPNLAELVRIAD